MTDTSLSNRDFKIALGVVLALTAVRIVTLFVSPFELHGDEAQYWNWSRDLTFGYFSKPPMIAWVIAATTAVFGNAEPCVRLSSPLFHAGTAIMLFFVGRELYGSRVGLWTAVLFTTLPAIFYSSLVISTDVPLLFFWAAALYAYIRVLRTRSYGWAVGLGVAIGLGLLSKYAMIYFIVLGLVYALCGRETRWLAYSAQGAIVAVLAALFILPNVWWNLDHSWVTIGHTAQNANWSEIKLHFNKFGDFFGAQFGLFGPFLLITLFCAGFTAFRAGEDRADRMLVTFSLPIILMVTVQALMSRAHANWAATAYVAATPLVAAWLSRGRWTWMRPASIGLHCFVGTILILLFSGAIGVPSWIKADPYYRISGSNALAREVEKRIGDRKFSAILTDDRMVISTLKYYLPEGDIPIIIWGGRDNHPMNHFELTSQIDFETGSKVFYVALTESPWEIVNRFPSRSYEGESEIAAGPRRSRTYKFYTLNDFQGFWRDPQ